MGELINQPSFAAGEIGPELYGRVDQALYYIGLRTCKNFIVRQYGGVANRPGTKFIAESLNHSRKSRLIPFQFNEEQTYVLDFGHQYFRVIRNGAEVLETEVNISAATSADPCVITATSHGFSNGDDVFIKDIVGMEELNNRTFRVANQTTNTFELQDMLGNNIDASAYTAYASGGTVARVYTVATPWEEDVLFDLNFAQSNDVLTVVHPDYYPRDITRTDHDAWTLTQFEAKQGPFKDINTDDTITVYTSAATGTGVTLTASSALFDSDMVGELFYIEQSPNDSTNRWEVAKAVVTNDVRRAGSHYYKAKNSATTGTWRPDHVEGEAYDGDGAVLWEYLHSGFGIVEITGYTSATQVTVTVVKRLPDNVVGASNTTDIWALAAWSFDEGYPSAVAYHKQRLWMAGTTNQPNGIWISGAGARTFFGKSVPILDDEAISMVLDTSGSKVSAVRHLIPLKQLVCLTSSSEQLITGVDGIILATDPPIAEVQGYNGSSKVQPIVIGNTAIFVQDMGSLVRSLAYNFDTDSFGGIDLTARSPHLFRDSTIVQWDFARHPLSVIWSVMSDGQLYGFTFMDEQRVYAWHKHETLGTFESVACIREGNETATYFKIKRTINGNTVRYTERMASRYFADVDDAFFVDSGLTYDGRNTSATTMTITGGTTWDSPETLTLTASASTFKSGDIGDYITFWDGNSLIQLEITAYSSATVVSVIPKREVPSAYRSTAFTTWNFARNTFRPLDHLEGQAVSVLADGNVVEGVTVTNGAAVIPEPAAVVHIGLPYQADLETLDIAQPEGRTKQLTFNVPRVFVDVMESRGLKYRINDKGDYYDAPEREVDLGYDRPIPAGTKVFEVQALAHWSKKGRVNIRQALPLPMTINCITPEIVIGKT